MNTINPYESIQINHVGIQMLKGDLIYINENCV